MTAFTNTTNDTSNGSDFALGIGSFTFSDLFRAERLKDLADEFYGFVRSENEVLHEALMQYIALRGSGYEPRAESQILTDAAPYLSEFVAKLFGVETERETLQKETAIQDPIWKYKFFVQRRAIKKFTAETSAMFDAASLSASMLELFDQYAPQVVENKLDEELATAILTTALLALEDKYTKDEPDQEKLAVIKAELDKIEAFSAYHFFRKDKKWASFKTPHALDYQNLVQIRRPATQLPNLIQGFDEHLRRRDGFKLTDLRGTQREVLYEVDYCLICHERDKDSCSKGLREKDSAPKRNPLGIKLEGCPLDEKISEMHLMKRHGDSLAALALVTIDNPMCPGTGHRICNDCMKGCIFQKQEPVNIPLVETSVLTDILAMPYGFEIYSLLTRWNPLNAKRPYALPYNGKNVLVVGLGPAGYTLAHYLINEGFGVVGIDGLKIEPLENDLTGNGGKYLPKAVRDITEIYKPLDERTLSGFGGVSEYGITVRWDKNFLTVLQLNLVRRAQFRAYGGIRFGGTLTIEDAWEFGFDHIAIATGAGRPTIVRMKNNLIRGIRKASDFLMALQLTGAFKRDNRANLQVRLPAVVVGGGLTGIDTATEIFAYYPVQVEKMLDAHEELCAEFGETEVFARFNEEEVAVYKEFLGHGEAIRAERRRASEAGEEPNFVPLVRSWGGVTLAYRKRMQDSPAYRLNHEEIAKALEEGIYIAELLDPREAVADEYGAVKEMIFEKIAFDAETGKFNNSGETAAFPARTVCVAAGTAPNVIYEKEYPGTFKLDEWNQFFQPYKLEKNGGGNFHAVEAAKGEEAFFTSYEHEGKFISYYGDNHPKYAGNVVKAMASAKNGYPKVVELFADEISALDASKQAEREAEFDTLISRFEEQILVEVIKVERLTPTIVDVVVKAPLQSKKFQPGQFYRLQNFETTAPMFDGTKLLMENLALTGASTDVEKGLLSMIVLEMGTSSRMCSLLEENEEVIVMGPTGTPTEIPENETVLLAGGGLGNAVLFSIAKALRDKNNKIIYFAGYRDGADMFKREEIEQAVDQVIWATDKGEEIAPNRRQDAHFRGNIVQAMIAYASGELGAQTVKLSDVDRIIAIGSDRMMNGVKEARYTTLKPYLKENHIAIGSINSPMQCMMKEVCAQCLQRHVNPHTGEEVFVFSCFNQDQSLDAVDFSNLNDRLRANSVQEKLSNLWLDKVFKNGADAVRQS